MLIPLNRKHRQTSNFQEMMSQITLDSRQFRGERKTFKSSSNECKNS